MTQPPTHQVFPINSTPSYDKFVPANSSPVQPQIEHSPQQPSVPTVDKLDELRREDQQYLDSIAVSQRNQALELLESEIREAQLFQSQRRTVKKRVNVASEVKRRADQPLFQSLGLPVTIKKRVGSKVYKKLDHSPVLDDRILDDTQTASSIAKEMKPVELVSGYSSSSEEP